MSAVEYMKAQKLAEKCYQQDVAKLESPNLPVLDEIIENVDIVSEVNLGLQHISLGRVVGTSTAGRTQAFASNFMPLLDFKTEFGAKWSSLYDSHVEEGIHDPIKVYEYMNYYYVVEGNKRVSVLKYFDADSIDAMVTRKLPKRDETFENKLYYEFVDFHKQTGINYLWFSRLGGFDKIRDILNLSGEDVLDEDARLDFNSAHLAFAKAFLAKAKGKDVDVTVDDAFLVFLTVYTYEELKDMTAAQVKVNVDKVWDEIVLSGEKKSKTISPKLEPVESKKSLLNKMNLAVPKSVKAAFVYDKGQDESVWIYSHELGRTATEKAFDGQLSTASFVNADKAELPALIEDIIAQGYDLIFTTGSEMLSEALKAAVAHPEVKILNCSLNLATSHVRTYYARMYEAKFITGLIAGSLCADGKLGYIADYPIYGVTANINAFALGAKLVNPRAKVYLAWTKVKGAEPKELFKEMGIKYISSMDMVTPELNTAEFGLYHINDDGSVENLATPFYEWSVFYEKMVQLILDGNWAVEEKGEKTKALNYWWGMSSGLVDVIASSHLPVGTTRLVNMMKYLIKSGTVNPFYGKLYSQTGVVRDDEDGEMTFDEIMQMDWLCENVVGAIPTIDDLVDEARDIVALQGLGTADSIELKKDV